jgi:hypothetical protein
MKSWLILGSITAAILLGGCGGRSNDNMTGDLTVPDTFLNDLNGAITTRDRDFIQNNVSFNYLDECQDINGFMGQLMNTLGTGGALSIGIDAPTDKVVNDLLGTASFTSRIEVDVDEGTDHRVFVRSGTFHLKAEGGKWKLYGDQQCHP